MNRKTRILIVYPGFRRKGGGVVTHASILIESLRGMGHDVSFFTCENFPFKLGYFLPLIERVVNKILPPLGYVVRFRLTSLMFRLFLPREWDAYVFEDPFSAIALSQPTVIFLHALKRDNLQGHKYLNEWALSVLKRYETASIMRFRPYCVTVSEEYAASVESRTAIELKVIENGINQALLPPLVPFGDRTIDLLYVGMLNARKNVGFLLDVLSIDKVSYSLYVIGEGPEMRELMRKAKKLGIEKRVLFLGALPRAEALDLMRTAKVMCLPSRYESFSFVLAEAKAMGMMTVAAEGLDVPDDLVDYWVKLVPDDWRKAIDEALASNGPTDEDVNKIRNKYNASRVAEEVLGMLERQDRDSVDASPHQRYQTTRVRRPQW